MKCPALTIQQYKCVGVNLQYTFFSFTAMAEKEEEYFVSYHTGTEPPSKSGGAGKKWGRAEKSIKPLSLKHLSFYNRWVRKKWGSAPQWSCACHNNCWIHYFKA